MAGRSRPILKKRDTCDSPESRSAQGHPEDDRRDRAACSPRALSSITRSRALCGALLGGRVGPAGTGVTTGRNTPAPERAHDFRAGGAQGRRVRGGAGAKFSRLLGGRGGVFAVKFTPGGFQPFAHVPVSRFTDTTVRLRGVFGPEGDVLDEAVLAATTDLSRIEIVE